MVMEKRETIWVLVLKGMVLAGVLIGVVAYTDGKGYFTADQSNNHIRKKWSSFYDHTRSKEVDVLILGNSHIITGVDPYVLSNAIGSTCFILGNSGTGIIDAWFQLAGALERCKPKLVILETYCIGPLEKPDSDVVPYLQSFDAQRDLRHKLLSLPELLDSDQWLAAWSPTIRNHSFLLRDTARINFNLTNADKPDSLKLDLGRFARFTYGLQDSTLAKYDTLGAPVRGEDYVLSDFSKVYLRKIMDLCKERNIPVLFLTVPMYHRHVSNYPAWQSKLAVELKRYPEARWLDLQMPYDTVRYTPDKFENTFEENQHLSNLGMLTTAYKLADHLLANYGDILPDRGSDSVWVSDFKETFHFEFNQDVGKQKEGFTSLTMDRKVGAYQVSELLLQENAESNRLILKVERKGAMPETVTAYLQVTMKGSNFRAPVKMYSNREIFPPRYQVYQADLLKEVKVNALSDIGS